MKKPLKQPFNTNTRKAIVSVTKGEDNNFDEFFISNMLSIKDHEKAELDLEFEPIQTRTYQRFINKYYMSRRMNSWLLEYKLEQFHKTHLFKKISQKLYLKIEREITENSSGQYPVFVIQQKLPKKKKEPDNQY